MRQSLAVTIGRSGTQDTTINKHEKTDRYDNIA